MSESKTPVCDKSKVDACWIMASHSGGEFVPLKDALKLELELNEAKAEVNNLLPQVQAYRDAEIKNPLARSESIALKWMNRALSAESQLTTAQQEIENLKASTVHSCTDQCQRIECVQRREIEGLKLSNATLLSHLGNMLDETRTTHRGYWPPDLLCNDCECNVSKLEPHKGNCKIGNASGYWETLSNSAMKGAKE